MATPSSQALPANPDPLAALPPLALPESISWWPPAPGWWLLSILCLLALGLTGYAAWHYWQAGLAKRLLLRHLKQLHSDYLHANEQPAEQRTYAYLQQANQLLRRFCLQHTGESRLASSTGESWLIALNQLSKNPCIGSDTGEQLLSLYQPRQTANIPEINQTLMRWGRGVRINSRVDSGFRKGQPEK